MYLVQSSLEGSGTLPEQTELLTVVLTVVVVVVVLVVIVAHVPDDVQSFFVTSNMEVPGQVYVLLMKEPSLLAMQRT